MTEAYEATYNLVEGVCSTVYADVESNAEYRTHVDVSRVANAFGPPTNLAINTSGFDVTWEVP